MVVCLTIFPSCRNLTGLWNLLLPKFAHSKQEYGKTCQSLRSTSVLNFGRDLKKEYAGEVLQGVLKMPSENSKPGRDPVEHKLFDCATFILILTPTSPAIL